jgi:hypothetical protein
LGSRCQNFVVLCNRGLVLGLWLFGCGVLLDAELLRRLAALDLDLEISVAADLDLKISESP